MKTRSLFHQAARINAIGSKLLTAPVIETLVTSDYTIAQERISVGAHWNFFFHSRSKCADFQIQRAGEGFQVAGSPDPEAERLSLLFALPLK